MNTMFTSTAGSTSGEDFSEICEGGEFMWHQLHAKDLGAQEFEGHRLVDLHNSTNHTVPLTWLLLDLPPQLRQAPVWGVDPES